jgi:hypothetical protein
VLFILIWDNTLKCEKVQEDEEDEHIATLKCEKVQEDEEDGSQ